jgi:Protein of unknown function (DUF3224)
VSKETNTSYTIADWKEETIKEFEGGKMTRAIVEKTYSGAIEGSGLQEYLMTYKADGIVDYLGMELITAKVDGKTGTFVLSEEGKFADGKATSECTVIPGSGTGELTGISGKGGYSVAHGESFEMWFEYEV